MANDTEMMILLGKKLVNPFSSQSDCMLFRISSEQNCLYNKTTKQNKMKKEEIICIRPLVAV